MTLIFLCKDFLLITKPCVLLCLLLCYSFTMWGLWISLSCLSALSAVHTHSSSHTFQTPHRQHDETVGNVLFTKAPQLSLNNLPSALGRETSKTWSCVALNVKYLANSKWERKKLKKGKCLCNFSVLFQYFWCNCLIPVVWECYSL